MSLGWGLRGYIGGGPLGAMIPGAMVALVLCRLLGIGSARSALVAAFGAVGVGFGGEMTYGQTVGFVREPATTAWGLLGLAVKGGVWGLLGGAVLGAGLELGPQVRRRLPWGLGGLVAGTAAGWALVNQPRLVYFSNLLDRPREEVWFGLLAGAIVFLATLRNHSATRFAVAGSLGGFVGFGVGGTWIYAGEFSGPTFAWVPWWKLMEFTFGGLFGLALAWAALRLPRAADLKDSPESWPGLSTLILAMVAFAGAILVGSELLPVRFGFAVCGAGLLAAATYGAWLRWPIALAITAAAFFTDWAEDHTANPETISATPAWTIAIFACIVYFAVLARRMGRGPLDARSAFWLLLWPAMFTAWARGLTAATLTEGLGAEHVLFAALLIWLLWWERQAVDEAAS